MLGLVTSCLYPSAQRWTWVWDGVALLGGPELIAEGLPVDKMRGRGIESGVRALNALGAKGASPPQSTILSQGQRDPLRHLEKASYSAPPLPHDDSAPAAWFTLQGMGAGYGSESLTAGVITNFQPGMLALPSRRAGAVSLMDDAPLICSSC